MTDIGLPVPRVERVISQRYQEKTDQLSALNELIASASMSMSPQPSRIRCGVHVNPSQPLRSAEMVGLVEIELAEHLIQVLAVREILAFGILNPTE